MDFPLEGLRSYAIDNSETKDALLLTLLLFGTRWSFLDFLTSLTVFRATDFRGFFFFVKTSSSSSLVLFFELQLQQLQQLKIEITIRQKVKFIKTKTPRVSKVGHSRLLKSKLVPPISIVCLVTEK